MSDELTTCNCADIAPTMPTCRDTHLATCPVSQYVEREFAKVRKMLKENDLEGLAAYASRNNSERAKHAVLRNQLAACQEQVRLTKGAMDAQDGREREAGEKCGVDYNTHGCDWPDAAAELIVHLRAKVTALEQERDEWHKKADDLFAVYTQWDKLDKAEAIAKANDLAARVRVLEEVFERHKAREKYIAEIVYQHIKHGDEKHQDWLRRELVNVICTEDTKACKTFDDLQQQLATANERVSVLEDDLENQRKVNFADLKSLRDARAAVVEECAKVAENTKSAAKDNFTWDCAAKAIAVAIRALAMKQQAQGTDTPTQGGPSE